MSPRTLGLRASQLLSTATGAVARGLKREQGQGLVEYSLILILIAVVLVLVVGVVGRQVSNAFSNVSHGLGT